MLAIEHTPDEAAVVTMTTRLLVLGARQLPASQEALGGRLGVLGHHGRHAVLVVGVVATEEGGEPVSSVGGRRGDLSAHE